MPACGFLAPVTHLRRIGARERFRFPLMIVATLLAVGLTGDRAQAQPAPYPDIAVSWAIVDNIHTAGFRFLITLENRGTAPLPASGGSCTST